VRPWPPESRPRPARSPWRLELRDDRGAASAAAHVVALSDTGSVQERAVDESGRFELPSEWDVAELFVARPGAFVHRADAVRVGASADAAPTRVELPLGKTLAGRVEVGGGPPREPLVLELDSDAHLWEGRGLPPEVVALLGNGRRTKVRTRADGSFRFHGLADDWRGVLWVPPSHRVVTERSGAYADESLYVERATEGLLVALAERGRVRGRVVDRAGTPRANVPVMLFAPGATQPVAARSDALGVFLATIEGPELTLEIGDNGAGPTTSVRFAPVPAGGDLGDVVADLAEPRDVRRFELAVLDDGGAAPAGLCVRLESDGALFANDAGAVSNPRALMARPRCALYAVPASGPLLLAGLRAEHDVRCSVVDATGAPLVSRVVPAGSHDIELELRVAAPLRTMDIDVRDEEGGLLLGSVVAFERHGERAAFRRTSLDGRATFPGVARATRAAAIVEVVKRGYVTTRLADVPLPAEGEPLVVTLRRGHDVVATLLDGARQPVEGATLTARWGDGERTATHLGGGRYRFDDLPRGTVTWRVQRGDTLEETPGEVVPFAAEAAETLIPWRGH
jgi:hypothetical protein